MHRTLAISTPALWALLLVAPMTAMPSQHATPAAFELPTPTGRYPIGTTEWRLTDRSRPETFAGPGEFRQVEVIAWYPAAAGGGAVAPYLREGVAEVRPFAKLFGAETAFDQVESVATHAEVDARPASTPAKLPLLVFSHGYTGMPSSYTALMEDLASHGYAVLSIVHPYEAGAATLADGRIVSMNGADGTFRQGIQDVLAEWGPEDQTMTAVTSATDDAEQIRLLRGYLATLKQTGVMLRRWVDDTRLVLDRLSGLPARSVASRLAARLDPSRIGAFGHSMGGVTSAQFCLEDARCRAGLNLDGIPQYGPMIDRRMPKPFLMVYSARPGRDGASDPIYRRAAHPYYRLDVRDTGHLEFTNMVFWGGPLRERNVLRALPPARAAEITAAIVRQYFDQELLGQRSPMLAGNSGYPEVTVKAGAAGR
jgi:alpha-beta hydrolase superfamily lysophospholipase